MANLIEQLDQQIAQLFASWNIYTTVIAVVLAAFVAYPLIFWAEPDTHPLLLARQARPSPIRNRGESAVYRSLEVPHGYPLRTGLNVKDPDAPRWSGGKDGDLRDIWRQVVRGGAGGDKGMLMTVLGKNASIEHKLEDITKEIVIIGQHLRSANGKKVAIYLPNSVEYLSTIFACAFYGLSPILLPFNQADDLIIQLLHESGADCLVANAGFLPLDAVCASAPGVRQVVRVVEKASRHMDWYGAPDGTQGKVTVSVWHDLVQEHESKTTGELPAGGDVVPGNMIVAWQLRQQGSAQLVEFTQQNLVSAIAALTSALPARQRFSSSDLVLPIDSFVNTYVLCQTFAALFSHASLAINSVASPGVDLTLATRSVSPTVVIASAETMANFHHYETQRITNTLQKMAHVSQAQAMSAGSMPTDTLLYKLFGSRGAAIGTTPGKLRLILVSERACSDLPALSSTMLSDLRIFTRVRVCYALVASKVAGAVAQTNLYDYRREDGAGSSHFGVPLSSVEIKLVGKDDSKLGGNVPQGEIVVKGPAVSRGEVNLGQQGTIREDCTLAYV